MKDMQNVKWRPCQSIGRQGLFWAVLACAGVLMGVPSLQAGSGAIEGTVRAECTNPQEAGVSDGKDGEGKGEEIPPPPPAPAMIAEVFNAKNAQLVATVAVSPDGSFNSGPVPAGEYRLSISFCFGVPESYADYGNRTFYNETAENPSVLCFGEGTVIAVADGAVSQVAALVGYPPPNPMPIPAVPVVIDGNVMNDQEDPLQGIAVELLAACETYPLLTAITDKQGHFRFPEKEVVEGEGFKIRFSDPTGKYAASFYGANADDFMAATLVGALAQITATLLPTPPDIEVAPLVADFGNVELPGAATAIVTIANRGGTDLHVSALSLVAGSSPCISIQSAPSLPFTLAPNASCEVTLEFEPRSLGDAAGTLAVASDDPDQGNILVALSGRGVASSAPPAEQVAITLEFLQESVAEGTLQGTGPGGSADAHVQALMNQIKAASDLAQAGKLQAACKQLENALKRTDGDPQPPDFVTGPAAPELRLLIELTRLALGCQ